MEQLTNRTYYLSQQYRLITLLLFKTYSRQSVNFNSTPCSGSCSSKNKFGPKYVQIFSFVYIKSYSSSYICLLEVSIRDDNRDVPEIHFSGYEAHFHLDEYVNIQHSIWFWKTLKIIDCVLRLRKCKWRNGNSIGNDIEICTLFYSWTACFVLD